MSTAEEFKAKGNKALVAKNFSEAIENYTQAINLDGTNHVYYSNRSAAYLSKSDAVNALEDANSCIALNPDFAKGYSRKGAALHALKRYNDSIAAYNQGLEKFPNDKGLTNGLQSVQKEKDGPTMTGGGGMGGMGGMPGMGGLFGPELMAKIAMDPKLRGYMSDPDFMSKLNQLQQDPNSLGSMLSDPRIMEVFQLILGQQGMQMKTGDEFRAEQEAKQAAESASTSASTSASESTTPAKKPKSEPEPEPEEMVEEEEDLSHLTPEERKIKEDQKAAVEAKTRGNDLYKSKKFDDALAAYDEAIALDPTNMTFLSNKAAVYFTTKQYDECIQACIDAVDVGQSNRDRKSVV